MDDISALRADEKLHNNDLALILLKMLKLCTAKNAKNATLTERTLLHRLALEPSFSSLRQRPPDLRGQECHKVIKETGGQQWVNIISHWVTTDETLPVIIELLFLLLGDIRVDRVLLALVVFEHYGNEEVQHDVLADQLKQNEEDGCDEGVPTVSAGTVLP